MTLDTRALNRLDRKIENLLPEVGKAFRAYAIKVGAVPTANGWADCGDGEAEGFATCFDGLIPEFVSCCVKEFGRPPAEIWVLNRIKDAVTREADTGRSGRERTVRFPTAPFMPSELFRRQDFRDAMLARISSHFPHSEARSINGELGGAVTDHRTAGNNEASATNRTTADSSGARNLVRPRRTPDIQSSRERVQLVYTLARELALVKQETKTYCTVEELKRKFPKFTLWTVIEDSQIKKLVEGEAFTPKAYAENLVLAKYGLTSRETLKKDRRKLRNAKSGKP